MHASRWSSSMQAQLRGRELAEPVECDTLVGLRRERRHELSGTIHQVDRRGMIHRVAAVLARNPLVIHPVGLGDGGDLIVLSGQSTDARVERRSILLPMR